jgi:GAF domain-containing protein
MSRLPGVFDALRAVAAQRLPDELFATMIRAAIEISGARKGYLLLPEDKWLRLAAEGESYGHCLNVRTHRESAPCPRVPISIITNVQHSHAHVVIADAAQDNPFSADPYLVNENVRSIVCLPMTSQTNLIGLVYL